MTIENFLDKDGKIKSWPSKRDAKIGVIRYLSTKFDADRCYTEKEVNEMIDEWHLFHDYFLLRRSLVEYRLMERMSDGSVYWLIQNKES